MALINFFESDNFFSPFESSLMTDIKFHMPTSFYDQEKNSGAVTGKSLSEALIFASINPQYDLYCLTF